jgi:probable HAF family extracellular repeat protein
MAQERLQTESFLLNRRWLRLVRAVHFTVSASAARVVSAERHKMSRLIFRHHDEQFRDVVALQLHSVRINTTTKVATGVVSKLAAATLRMSRPRPAGLVALVCALATTAAAQTVTIQSILPLPPMGTITSINGLGDVAGNEPPNNAAVYSHGIVTLLDAGIPNVCCGTAYAINDSGQVAGEAIFGNVHHAFQYSGGVLQDIGTLSGDQWSYARGINASGEVVGWSGAPGRTHAFLYSGGVMHDLGTLGGQNSQATAINDAGDVVGSSEVPAGGASRAFLYRNGVMQDLGSLQPGGTSLASAISANGQITGTASPCCRAFLYANGVMTDLGAPINTESYGLGINASGQIVGQYLIASSYWAAFLYTPRSGFLNLNSLLPPNSGWNLQLAVAINDAGQIVGQGDYLGWNRGFLLTINTTGTAPITTATISGPNKANGWYLGAVSVTLSATSQSSSVAATYFSVDGAAYQLYGGPFPIAGDGTHQLSYYSVDTKGSQEKAVQQTIRIDSTKPVSHVAGLPATVLTTSFSVTWSGADATSGIASYTIFVADNGGAFAPWISGTAPAQATQATYTGVAGHTYGFYSIATDVTGNQELAKTAAEAMTTVPTQPVSHVAPLPANAPAANFTVQWSGSAPGVGIRDYTIYVSDNGGAFAPWLSATTSVQGTYAGVCEHNYGFYSIATDNHGLQEVAKTAVEATTRVPFNPVSHVLALPGIAPSPNFNVQWAGVNTCTPIQTWDIYVSDNGGAFAMWKARTSATQAYFSGALGHSYGFYSIAFDSGGSAEAPKSVADAMTQTPAVMAADVNSDGRIDCADVSVVKAAMGTRSGQVGFNARADLNGDGLVDVRDLALVTQKLAPGTTCP